ncbi:MAG TPA: DUF4129 domain-containing protein [Steroidobacteraceae bacterium]|nr:DUF4129 domain-containing protein [Steroidobacteraceae bacterium]
MGRTSLLPCLLAAGLMQAGAHAGALDDVRNCALRVDSTVHGLAALEARCPGLTQSLSALGWPGQLPESWQSTVNGDALLDLGELGLRYQVAAPRSTLQTVALDRILKAMALEKPRTGHSWWQRFKDWLGSWLTARDSDQDSWLARWLDAHSLSESALRILVYLLLGAVVSAALLVVANELRAAGLLAPRAPGATPGQAPPDQPANATPAPTLRDLERSALDAQPALLLRLLVARLRALDLLPADRNLTHRELVARAGLTAPRQREQFADVARLAERVVYGGEGVRTGADETVLGQGRALLQQLELSRGASA